MKKCPYCAELIGSNSKRCKYCGEIVSVEKQKLPNIMRQSPVAIKAVVFIIASNAIISFILNLLAKPLDAYVAAIVILDLFLCYHLLKMEYWARKWIIDKCIYLLS